MRLAALTNQQSPSDDPLASGTVVWVKALQFSRNEPRYAAAAVSSRFRPGSGASSGPLQLVNVEPPDLPDSGWQRIRTRLAGICGSDLATVDGQSARYFEPWVSFPFIPGHEVLGTNEKGERVVLEPVLGHEARGFEPPFANAAPGDGNDYRHIVSGHIEPGIQTGYCSSTGGGWASEFVAHQSQLHLVPKELGDEAAVMVEPAAVGVHAAIKAQVQPGDTVGIIGAGTMGLVTLAAVRQFCEAGRIVVAAKYPEQVDIAKQLGADSVVKPNEFSRAIRRATGSFVIGDDLSGGADVIIDAVGSARSVNESIGVCRPRGRVVLVGMPGKLSVDLTAVWHRETELVGAYTYGTESLPDGSTRRSFDMALELAHEAKLGQLVSATYPLDAYRDALLHAASAGKRGAIKVCFDLR